MPYVTTLWCGHHRAGRHHRSASGCEASGWANSCWAAPRISADTWLGLALVPVLSVVVIGALTLSPVAGGVTNVQANPFEALIRSPRDW